MTDKEVLDQIVNMLIRADRLAAMPPIIVSLPEDLPKADKLPGLLTKD